MPWPLTPATGNAPDADDALNSVPAPVLFAVGLAVALVLHRAQRLPARPRRLFRGMGAWMLAAGAALFGWAVYTMLQAGTSPVPSDPVTAVVDRGPYALSRNPLYAAYALVYTGAGLRANTLWPALTLPFVMKALEQLVVEKEEAYLEGRFGRDYQRYLERVPRWL